MLFSEGSGYSLIPVEAFYGRNCMIASNTNAREGNQARNRSNTLVMNSNMRVVPIDDDGDCFFQAVTYHLLRHIRNGQNRELIEHLDRFDINRISA